MEVMRQHGEYTSFRLQVLAQYVLKEQQKQEPARQQLRGIHPLLQLALLGPEEDFDFAVSPGSEWGHLGSSGSSYA